MLCEFLEEVIDTLGGLLQRQCTELADWNMLFFFLIESKSPGSWFCHLCELVILTSLDLDSHF